MRTFPKSLAAFRKLVEERGQRLRSLTSEELQRLAAKPSEQLTFDSRPAIAVIVQPGPDGSFRVVI